MFEKRKERQAEAKLQADLATWESNRKEVCALLDIVRNAKLAPVEGVLLKSNEGGVAIVKGAHLVEQVRGKGHYAGRSSGVSIPIGSADGRTVRYRVGASKGHYVQDPPHPQTTDTGTLVVTNKRILFIGAKRTVECLFTKVIALSVDSGVVTVSVSNRQKPTVISVGKSLEDWLTPRLNIALAFHNNDTSGVLQGLEDALREFDASKPSAAVLGS